jgi:hypothetical protein
MWQAKPEISRSVPEVSHLLGHIPSYSAGLPPSRSTGRAKHSARDTGIRSRQFCRLDREIIRSQSQQAAWNDDYMLSLLTG